jgi:hypothetical protein
MKLPHQDSVAINGAQRLYQLFKNAVVLSLIRSEKVSLNDPASQRLFNGIALASMREAQRVVIHIFDYHYQEIRSQRKCLMDAMTFWQEGRTGAVTTPSSKHQLDGLFKIYFDHMDSETRKKQLDKLYHDKSLMINAAIAFIVIFQNFLNNPEYYIQGISPTGINSKGG